MNAQPDLIPDNHGVEHIVVSGADLARTVSRLKAIGGVILAFSVHGSTYTLSVLMPPAEMIEEQR